MGFNSQARGFAIAPLVLFICTCAPAPPPPPPAANTLDASVLALRTGDVAGLQQHLGKGPGFAARATELAARHDPEAWLVALGAVEREYDLPRAAAAMRRGDDAELADALGFGPQALMQDVLRGGGSVYTRRAEARNFYQTGAQPIALLDDVQTPVIPPGADALHVTLWGRIEGRDLRVRYGLNTRGVTSIQADAELARRQINLPQSARRESNAAHAVPRVGPCAGLDLSGLADPRWYAAQFIVLTGAGDLQRVLLARDTGWGVVEHELTSRQQRQEDLRDQRLNFMRRRAGSMLRSTGRWPRGTFDLNVQARELSDPVKDPWGEFAADPQPDFVIAPDADGDWYAATLHVTRQGRRAVAGDGQFLWIE